MSSSLSGLSSPDSIIKKIHVNHQPKALSILIPTEMAETYGYFTLQAILVLYLIKELSYSDANAYAFSGQFVALAYLMPVIGGWLADRLLGNRIAILLGGLLLCMGYALLTLGQYSLFAGLSLIVIGNGLFKANISSFIGEFYTQNDSRREAGFTLAYTGINLGSLFAIAGVGYIQKYIGWGACFGAASFALLLGVSVFRWGFHYFNNKGLPPNIQSKTLWAFLTNKPAIFLWLCVAFIIVYYLLKDTMFGTYSIYLIGLLFCLYVAKISQQLDANARRNLLALMILFLIATFYKAMFFETYLVVNVFTDRLVDRTVFGHEIPATVFLSLGSLFTILLGPLIAYIWQSNKIILSIPVKFALSILIVGGCMQMLAAWLTIETNVILPAASILFFRFFFAISELFILPLGLSMVTEYAPKNCVGLMMGGWYITAAFGGKLAGILANYADVPKDTMDLHHLKTIYHLAFQHYALLNFVLFAVCLMLVPIINKLLNKRISY